MSTLQSLRWQHDQASSGKLRLVNLIEAHRPGDDAYPIALQLARWTGLLRAHLASEYEWFYPALIASPNSETAATARAFQTEMGHLAERLEAFDRRWSSSAVIGAGFSRFHREAFALFAAFDQRISREDRTLYPMAESQGVGAITNAA
ncbi:MAG: hemerythrin domain-containing protein [Pseudomonadota bacterium]|nr:hemerythrin domain-containing protein [Pseudomonadota bacterium]